MELALSDRLVSFHYDFGPCEHKEPKQWTHIVELSFKNSPAIVCIQHRIIYNPWSVKRSSLCLAIWNYWNRVWSDKVMSHTWNMINKMRFSRIFRKKPIQRPRKKLTLYIYMLFMHFNVAHSNVYIQTLHHERVCIWYMHTIQTVRMSKIDILTNKWWQMHGSCKNTNGYSSSTKMQKHKRW